MTDTINERLAALEKRIARVEDIGEIERLHYQYGYYLDNRMWDEVADTFCDEAPSIEIGQRGLYVGKDRVRRFLHEVLGGGRWGLVQNEIINHIQLQLVTTLADDRMSAEVRSRALVQGNSPPGSGKMLLAEGIYENRFVREGERWKIKHVGWVPTYYFEVAGFDGAVFDSGPESTAFPPDRSATPRDAGLGRRFKPFHYRYPFTRDVVPSPSGEMPMGDEP